VCTIPSNLAGDPAISVPFGVGDDGMPVGVQLLGPALSEATLLRAAAVLEAAAPTPDEDTAALPVATGAGG
jgi:aspartyl-tRNA(Asn)/glutamyl-tRNA(Gln) amidotransferase subunit A